MSWGMIFGTPTSKDCLEAGRAAGRLGREQAQVEDRQEQDAAVGGVDDPGAAGGSARVTA